MKARLKCDVKSSCSNRMYGLAGDVVTVIDKRGVVYLLEDANGSRFPAHENNVVDAEAEIEITKMEEKIIIKPEKVAARPPKAKPSPQNQQSLF